MTTTTITTTATTMSAQTHHAMLLGSIPRLRLLASDTTDALIVTHRHEITDRA
jgi:hypothetical protein